MSLASLIAEVEKLNSPSREVDCEVAIALCILPEWCRFNGDEIFYVRKTVIGPEVAVTRPGKRKSSGDRPVWQTTDYAPGDILPAYTASIDAVVALIERELPGWMWTLNGDKGEYDACLSTDHGRFLITEDTERYGKGPNGAIALLLAFLRALESSRGRD